MILCNHGLSVVNIYIGIDILLGGLMVYSHWLGPELGPGQGLAPVLCGTFHIAQGPGRMGCMVLIRTFHTAPEQGQGRTLVFITRHIFRT